jgi:SAM-dependent methyltransferase
MHAPLTKTTERIIPEHFRTREERLLYLRHVFAYEYAKRLIGSETTVLEVGCGEGYGTTLLAQVAAQVTGLDVDAQTIAHAAEKYRRQGLEFKHYDGHRMPFADSCFDVVVSFQVVEHVHDDSWFAAEAARVTKPGGVFILTTPNRSYRLRPGQKPWNRFHLREYDASSLEATLHSHFTDVSIRGVRGSAEVQRIEHARVAWALRKGPVSAIRRVMPEWSRRALGGLLRTFRRQTGAEASDHARYSLDDYSVIIENVNDSLDLLAVCRK